LIISDRHRFAFIHIPKCAGSYVSRKLDPYDDAQGEFRCGVKTHPVLGAIDYHHLPLTVLRQHFPSAFERLVNYRSYALLRDPFERFPSSVAQRIKVYRGVPLHRMSPRDLESEVESIIEHLSSREQILEPEYAHFTRQSDFVAIDDKHIVECLYLVEDVDIMLSHIENLAGITLPSPEKSSTVNRADVYRNEYFRQTLEWLRPFISGTPLKFIPQWLQQGIRRSIYTPAQNRLPAIFSSASVNHFVREHYDRDIQLVESIRATRGTASHAKGGPSH
jgi:hypothetical protein